MKNLIKWIVAVLACMFCMTGFAAAATDGFESGDFSALPWSAYADPAGGATWSVHSSKAQAGQFAAAAPDSLGTNQSAYLELTTATGAGNFVFYLSTAASLGTVYFYIDNVFKGSTSGVTAWTQKSFAVAAGVHTFRWRYLKTSATSTGADVAWIDSVSFPDPPDSDGDGRYDYQDNCPATVNADQANADGDAYGDACDACPNDSGKNVPGQCGCGVADTDSDGDGIANCIDRCPNDSNNDSDSDGFCSGSSFQAPAVGANDNCPLVSNSDQVDNDVDGVGNVCDICVDDPNKTVTNVCGCGNPDTDTDGDGTADCIDNCPADPGKTALGICGCGTPDTDIDGDGVADCNDNCPHVANGTQDDADSDGIGDVCENFDKLLANDGDLTDRFGYSVAVSGETLLIGAYLDEPHGSASGSAYVYQLVNGRWLQQQKLVPADNAIADRFGNAVAISGNWAIIGAQFADYPGEFGPASNAGAVYFYRHDGNSWVEQQKLFAADAEANAEFGTAVAINGNYAIVGAPRHGLTGVEYGAVYVYFYNGRHWVEQQKLIAGDAGNGDYFGSAVAISGLRAIVGAFQDDDVATTNSGSAYIFDSANGTSWAQSAKLISSSNLSNHYFGHGVAINGNHALVGANTFDAGGFCGSECAFGAVYTFSYNGSVWSQGQVLYPPQKESFVYFGHAVAMTSDTAVVSAHGYDGGVATPPENIHVYKLNTGVWTLDQTLTPADNVIGDEFGYAVGIAAGKVVAGAYLDDDLGTDAGSAYVYVDASVPADIDLDGIPDGSDACPHDPLNDLDADGVCGDLDHCPGFNDNLDSDGDGVADACDAFPTNINEWFDDDGDTVGGNADCNDKNASIYPGATEVVGDGIDQNCDGQEVCYVDADGDGARTAATVISTDTDCLDTGEALATAEPDCNDADPAIRPGVLEIAGDEVDQNCDGLEVCYWDQDDDGYRWTTYKFSDDADCQDVQESPASAALDCVDNNALINPGAEEICADGIDQNCDGVDPVCFTDTDSDLMDDAWETRYGLNVGVADGGGDLDGDGVTNLDEYLNGSDPSRVGSLPPGYRLPAFSVPLQTPGEGGALDGQRPLPQ